MTDLAALGPHLDHIIIERSGPLVELRVHTDGGPLMWGPGPHRELGLAFRAIAQDTTAQVVIITGTGDAFSGPRASEVDIDFHAMPPADWEELHRHGMELMDSLLSIQAIVIGAVNGPAVRHAELALLSDIVVCSEDAEFQDSAHFPDGLTPGDGINVLMPLLVGLNRARYFHLTGQRVPARQALEWGLVSEVVPKDEVMPRARELAQTLMEQDPMILRHTRLLFTHDLRRRMLDMVGYGLALEGLDVANAAARHRPDG
jgi:enoyl-CoA hydratase/carnithine racemase